MLNLWGCDIRVPPEGILCSSLQVSAPARGHFFRGPWEMEPCTFSTFCICVRVWGIRFNPRLCHSVSPSANAELGLPVITEPSLGPCTIPSLWSPGCGKNLMSLIILRWVCPALGLTENADSFCDSQAPTAAHHPAGWLP